MTTTTPSLIDLLNSRGTKGTLDALAPIIAKAKHSLPNSHSRINKAVDMILGGAVTLLADGSAQVASQSRPEVSYAVNGSCPCLDFMPAPHHLCKHKLAAAIATRLQEADTLSPPLGVSFDEYSGGTGSRW